MEDEFNKRFFEAIDALIAQGQIKSLTGYIISLGRHSSRYRNLRATTYYGKKVKHQYSRVEYCVILDLVKTYHVNLYWLFLGVGKMFAPIPKQ